MAQEIHSCLGKDRSPGLGVVPDLSSWCGAGDTVEVERWFAELQRRCLERGVFCSLDELTAALEEWIKLWNEAARPFTWTRTPDQIIDRAGPRRKAREGSVGGQAGDRRQFGD